MSKNNGHNGYPPAQYETFTPDQLREILKRLKVKRRNPRRMIEAHANRLREAVDAGKFAAMNGQTLVFDKDGYLVNGQHRAEAHALAEQPLTILTVRGVTEGIDEIDSGRKRSLSDILSGRGWSDAAVIAAAAKVLAGIFANEDPFVTNYGAPTPGQLLTTVAKLRRPVIQAAALLSRRGAHKLLPPGTYCAVLYQAMLLDSAKAERFADLVNKGVGLAEDHPAFALRRFFLSRGQVGGFDWRRTAYGVTVKAWNLFRSGQKAGRMRLLSGEALPVVE